MSETDYAKEAHLLKADKDMLLHKPFESFTDSDYQTFILFSYDAYFMLQGTELEAGNASYAKQKFNDICQKYTNYIYSKTRDKDIALDAISKIIQAVKAQPK